MEQDIIEFTKDQNNFMQAIKILSQYSLAAKKIVINNQNCEKKASQ